MTDSNSLLRFNQVLSREVFQSGALPDQGCIDLKAYFVAVKKRHDGGEQFPYNLEELIPTVFAQKVKAIEALKRDFMEGIDYCLISRQVNDENSVSGYRTTTDYYLSPLAFEFMVARKNKDVFRVYHEIFHLKASSAIPDFSSPAEAARAWGLGQQRALS